MSLGGEHPAALEPAARAVDHGVERRQPSGGEFRRLRQHRSQRFRTGVALRPEQFAQAVQARRGLDLGCDGGDVGRRRQVEHQRLVAITSEKWP